MRRKKRAESEGNLRPNEKKRDANPRRTRKQTQGFFNLKFFAVFGCESEALLFFRRFLLLFVSLSRRQHEFEQRVEVEAGKLFGVILKVNVGFDVF